MKYYYFKILSVLNIVLLLALVTVGLFAEVNVRALLLIIGGVDFIIISFLPWPLVGGRFERIMMITLGVMFIIWGSWLMGSTTAQSSSGTYKQTIQHLQQHKLVYSGLALQVQVCDPTLTPEKCQKEKDRSVNIGTGLVFLLFAIFWFWYYRPMYKGEGWWADYSDLD